MADRKTEMGTAGWFEAAFGRFYADLYAHRDDSEAEALLRTLAPLLPAEGPVLDLACGGGRLLRLLRRRYPDAVGLDLSAELLGLARACGPEFRLVRADMRALPLARESFAAVFSLFTSFGYFADPEEDRLTLERVVRRLRPLGIFVLDFLNARRVIGELVPHSREQIGDRDVESVRSYDPLTQVIRKVVRVHEGSEIAWEYEERVRAYLPSQLDEICGGVGLDVVVRYGDYAGGPFDESSSPRYILVGCKGKV